MSRFSANSSEVRSFISAVENGSGSPEEKLERLRKYKEDGSFCADGDHWLREAIRRAEISARLSQTWSRN